MAAGCDGEHTRFPFLATVRSLVATVVTVLGVAVVVMVIVVLHRPFHMAVSTRRYIYADDWWKNNTDSLVSYAYGPAGAVAGSPVHGPADGTKPAEQVDIFLDLSAFNPSGSTQMMGSIKNIRIIDIQKNENNNDTLDTCFFEPKIASVKFDLPAHSWHSYRRWVTIWHKDTLQYLYNNHLKDTTGFSTMLMVKTTYETPGHSEKSMSYYCSPVTFISISEMEHIPDIADRVTCKTAQEMRYKPNIEPGPDCKG